MSEEYGSDFITITDEDGKEYELEVLASVEYNGITYFAMAPADPEDGEETEICVLKQVVEDGEELFATVDDEEEWDAVNEKLIELLNRDLSPETEAAALRLFDEMHAMLFGGGKQTKKEIVKEMNGWQSPDSGP